VKIKNAILSITALSGNIPLIVMSTDVFFTMLSVVILNVVVASVVAPHLIKIFFFAGSEFGAAS
jgi:hypothetical protein